MLFSRKKYQSKMKDLYLGEHVVQLVSSHKHLGLLFNTSLSWTDHIEHQVSRCNKLLGQLKKFKYRWSRKALETCYLSYIRPILEYCDILYDSCTVAEAQN